jgi:hypothetical protein
MISYEYCIVPDNFITRTARQLMNRYSIDRNEREDRIFEQEQNRTIGLQVHKPGKYHQCCNCTRNKIKTKYHVDDMLPVDSICKSKGKPVKYTRYYCSACAVKYKSHAERVGGQTF